jgi:hypothetical protein
MTTKNSQLSSHIFNCQICDYTCSRLNDYNKHLTTRKHINTTNYNNKSHKFFNCECGKKYKHRASLHNHKKKCKENVESSAEILIEPTLENNINIPDASNNIVQLLIKENCDFKTIIMDLVKSNTDLQKHVLDVCKNNNQPTTINSNNNNKTFNLQFFLNEQCKDAMNISDFVNSFQLKLEDLERLGQQGYVNGISNIIIKKIKETDIYKRPFHCSDAKRETLYVKDINGWEREGAENAKMTKAVKDVGQKNFTILNDYRLLHPECTQADSVYNDKYVQMMIQAAGSQKENVNKVIKKISKEVIIEKNSD